jgi:multidrug efflux pump subunit AcrA (membrane-fusion protein)
VTCGLLLSLHGLGASHAQEQAGLISPNRVADIGSPVTGVIEEVAVDVGDTVREGQRLVALRSEVESAGERAARARWSPEAEVRAAEASLELAQQRHVRSRELLEQGFISPLAVEQSHTELRLAEQKLVQSRSQRAVLANDLEVVRAQVNQRVVRAPFGVKPVAAQVTHVDRVIDAASNTFRVRLSLPNPKQRLPAGVRCSLVENPAPTESPGGRG